MKAVKCDRCQKFFTEEILMVTYQYPDEPNARYEVDLCPDCMRDFVKFMKGEKDGSGRTNEP